MGCSEDFRPEPGEDCQAGPDPITELPEIRAKLDALLERNQAPPARYDAEFERIRLGGFKPCHCVYCQSRRTMREPS